VLFVQKALRRLRLREGDVILVRDHETLERLVVAGRAVKNIPDCPIVVAPQGVHRLSKDYLRRLLADTQPTE
jgi:hypothetical protein